MIRVCSRLRHGPVGRWCDPHGRRNPRKVASGSGVLFLTRLTVVGGSYDFYDARTLIIHGGQDSIVPARFSERLAERSSVDWMLYPDLQYETLNEPEGPAIVTDIINWIRKQLNGS